MKIAIVHDWLVNYAGAEKVLEEIIKLYPDADLFSVVDFLPKNQRSFILNKPVQTTFIQRLPFAKKKYRSYLPLMPLAVEQFDLSTYELIISSSHAVAKSVITGPDQLHICYIHSPIRYAWDLQYQYLRESNLDRGIKGFIVKYLLHRIRIWDVSTANRVDEYIANSNFIRRRIKKVYRRDATVIFPPVSVEDFNLVEERGDYYVTASRIVPYKKIDLIVEAFCKMPDKKLCIIGEGPDFNKILKKADGADNIEIMGYQPFSILRKKLSSAKAFVFAAEEDFGITPVEAQACGTPVIAYAKGGVLETILENKTGVFFEEQTVDALVDAVKRFEMVDFDSQFIRSHAENFDKNFFSRQFSKFVELKYRIFKENC